MNANELRSQIATFNDEIAEIQSAISPLKSEKFNLMKRVKEIEIEEKRQNNIINTKRNEIAKINDLLTIEDMYDELMTIDSFNIISRDELDIIIKNMDKTDYTQRVASVPRFIDIKKIIHEVIHYKQKYPTFIGTLDNMRKKGQLDTYPPTNYYEYTFKTVNGEDYFRIGGVEVINN